MMDRREEIQIYEGESELQFVTFTHPDTSAPEGAVTKLFAAAAQYFAACTHDEDIGPEVHFCEMGITDDYEGWWLKVYGHWERDEGDGE